MSALDGLKKMSFSGNEFPAERITLHSQGRQYLFEFPKQPAGAFEKLGRGIWVIGVSTYFAQGLRGYPDSLYPDTMNTLRAMYESQTSATFHHPTVGDFKAFISSWKQDYNPRSMRNGERVEVEFVEDQQTDFLAQAPASIRGLNSATMAFATAFAAIPWDPRGGGSAADISTGTSAGSLFSALKATSNALSALQGTTAMYTGLLQAKAIELSNLCAQIDALPIMQPPTALGALDALHDLWFAATQFTRPQGTPLSTWTVPRTMSIQQIATQLYGDTSRVSDLLNLNGAVITDPDAVRAATQIRYFRTPTTTSYGGASANSAVQ